MLLAKWWLRSSALALSRYCRRRWVIQAQVNAGVKEGPNSSELDEIKRLRAEVPDREESNEILKQASIFFARELGPRRR